MERPLAVHSWGAALLGTLFAACGGAADDDDSSQAATPSSTSNTATSSSTGTATATAGGSATSGSGVTSGGGATGSGSGQTASTSTATSGSTTGATGPWLCLEVSSGCLCSTIPGSEGEAEPCATAYDCCYGLEGSTCYCIETPAAMCDEIIEVGYTRYDSCPPR